MKYLPSGKQVEEEIINVKKNSLYGVGNAEVPVADWNAEIHEYRATYDPVINIDTIEGMTEVLRDTPPMDYPEPTTEMMAEYNEIIHRGTRAARAREEVENYINEVVEYRHRRTIEGWTIEGLQQIEEEGGVRMIRRDENEPQRMEELPDYTSTIYNTDGSLESVENGMHGNTTPTRHRRTIEIETRIDEEELTLEDRIIQNNDIYEEVGLTPVNLNEPNRDLGTIDDIVTQIGTLWEGNDVNTDGNEELQG